MRPFPLRTLLAVGFALLPALALANDQPASVTVKDYTFTPATVTIAKGGTVTWTNRDDTPHSVVVQGRFRSPPMDTNDSYSRTFADPGEYDYVCGLHPQMKGKIVVVP